MNDLDEVFEESEAVQSEQPVDESETTPVSAEPDVAAEIQGEKDAGTPTAKDNEGWEAKAFKKEKRKRQEMQAELERLKEQVNADPVEPEKTIDPLEDPQGYLEQMEQRLLKVQLETRINTSAMFMKREHDDYPEKEATFMKMAKADPLLAAKMQNHPFPAEFVYNTVSERELLDEIKDPDAYRKKIREEVLAELNTTPEEPTKTPSLANLTASGQNVVTKETVDTLSEIFRDSPL